MIKILIYQRFHYLHFQWELLTESTINGNEMTTPHSVVHCQGEFKLDREDPRWQFTYESKETILPKGKRAPFWEKVCDQEQICVERTGAKYKEEGLPIANNLLDNSYGNSKLSDKFREMENYPRYLKSRIKTYSLIAGGVLVSIYCFYRAYKNLSALRKVEEKRLGSICKVVAWVFAGTISANVSLSSYIVRNNSF